MSLKIQIAELDPNKLSPESVKLISLFARELKLQTGQVLKLGGPNVLEGLVSYAKHTENPQLEILYLKIKAELKRYVNSPEFNSAPFDDEIHQHTETTRESLWHWPIQGHT